MSDSDSINDELSSGFSEEDNPVFFSDAISSDQITPFNEPEPEPELEPEIELEHEPEPEPEPVPDRYNIFIPPVYESIEIERRGINNMHKHMLNPEFKLNKTNKNTLWRQAKIFLKEINKNENKIFKEGEICYYNGDKVKIINSKDLNTRTYLIYDPNQKQFTIIPNYLLSKNPFTASLKNKKKHKKKKTKKHKHKKTKKKKYSKNKY